MWKYLAQNLEANLNIVCDSTEAGLVTESINKS